MLPLLALGFIVGGLFAGCSASSRKTSENPDSENQKKTCPLTRDEFVEYAFTGAVSSERLKGIKITDKDAIPCVMSEAETRNDFSTVLSGKASSLNPLQESVVESMMEFHGYRPEIYDDYNDKYYFRPDQPVLRKKLSDLYQQLISADPKSTQTILVQFDLDRLFENQKSPAQIREFENQIFEKIVGFYQGKSGKGLPRLVITREKPADGGAITLLSITDKDIADIAKQNRDLKVKFVREILSSHRGLDPLYLDEIKLQGLRRNFAIPQQVTDEKVPEFLADHPDLQAYFSGGSNQLGITLMANPDLMEFGNRNLDETIFVFAGNVRSNVPEEKKLIEVIAMTSCHEIGHALGLLHYSQGKNLMVPAMDEATQYPQFNRWQQAYLEKLFGSSGVAR